MVAAHLGKAGSGVGSLYRSQKAEPILQNNGYYYYYYYCTTTIDEYVLYVFLNCFCVRASIARSHLHDDARLTCDDIACEVAYL